MDKPVCLIPGAGAGIGGNVAKRFAREGYHACDMARQLGCMPEVMTHLHTHVKRLEARPAFAKGIKT